MKNFSIIILVSLFSLNFFSQVQPNSSKINNNDDDIIVVPYESHNKNSSFGGKQIEKVLGNGYGLVYSFATDGRKIYGIIDKNGKQVLPTVYSNILQSGKFIITTLGELHSAYDLKMKRVLPPQFMAIDAINDTLLSAISFNYMKQLYDNKGNHINIEDAKSVYEFNFYRPEILNKYLLIEKSDGQNGIYDLIKKKIVREYGFCRYDLFGSQSVLVSEFFPYQTKLKNQFLLNFDFEPISSYKYTSLYFIRPNYYIANMNGKYGLIDEKEKNIIPIIYNNLQLHNDFETYNFLAKKDNKFGVINIDSKIILSFSYDSIFPFNISNNKFVCLKNGMYGVVGLDDKELIPFNYTNFYPKFVGKFIFKSQDSLVVYNSNCTKLDSYESKNVQMDKSFEFVIIKNSSNKYGVLDKSFEELIPFEFDNINYLEYSYQTFIVQSKEKSGIYRSKNFYPLKTNYDKFIIYGKYYLVIKNSKYGLISFDNFQEILPCEYDEISYMPYDSNKIIAIKGVDAKTIEVK